MSLDPVYNRVVSRNRKKLTNHKQDYKRIIDYDWSINSYDYGLQFCCRRDLRNSIHRSKLHYSTYATVKVKAHAQLYVYCIYVIYMHT